MTEYERPEYAIGNLDSTERGTTARANKGKVRLSLVPKILLSGVARVFEFGLKKYNEWNWTKGSNWSVPYECLDRHLNEFWYCLQDNDPESGELHLDHAMANLLMLIHYFHTFKDGDDRPKEWSQFNTYLKHAFKGHKGDNENGGA
jgi:hypothetical protein